MTYSVRLSAQAKQDLGDIYDYIAFDLQNQLAAESLLSRLEKAILSLDEMPGRYRVYEKEPWHSRGLRVMPVENYMVFYLVEAETRTVTILRVMYGGRDMASHLN